VLEALITHWPDHRRRIGGVGLQNHVGGLNHFEHLAQEAHIEGNQQWRAVNGGVHHHLGGAGLLGAGGDLQL